MNATAAMQRAIEISQLGLGKTKGNPIVGAVIFNESEIGIDLGSRVTIVQFSSAFCSPCKATAQIIKNLIKDMDDVAYVQIQSEEHIALIEKFDIKSTPTVIFFNGMGMEVGRATGTPTNQQVLAAIASVR